MPRKALQQDSPLTDGEGLRTRVQEETVPGDMLFHPGWDRWALRLAVLVVGHPSKPPLRSGEEARLSPALLGRPFASPSSR